MPSLPVPAAETKDLFDRIGHAALARQQQRRAESFIWSLVVARASGACEGVCGSV